MTSGGTHFSKLTKRINEYTGQLLMGPNALWPTQPNVWALAHPAYPVAPPWVMRDAVSFPSGVRGTAPTTVAFCCIKCYFKTHLDAAFWFFGQHCNEWQNEIQSRLRSNMVSAGNLRHINIIHSRSNWQVNRQLYSP